ncbi:M56 family metallopeptidase [Streptomyces sp. MAR4 CNX-425]|uniref:M56 family metallopeptidase n=1 Tax=Streptomyces sp. MAR4 CNX-425 TaxID=3406343 RepID=UPI003B510DFB
MRVALLLVGYAATLALVGPLLARASWSARAPRLAILAWQALTAAVVASVALAGVALVVPSVPVSGNVAELLHACVMMLREQYATPGGAAAAAGGLVFALFVVLRVGGFLVVGLVRARRERSRHAEVLAVVGGYRADLGVTVLDHARPAVYCLPGAGHRIVLTSAALAALSPSALDAVIAHERAHIRQRHHLALAYADAMERAFPKVALFRLAAEHTRRLVELAADDAACSRADSLALAGALLDLAGTGAPAAAPPAALAASGGQVGPRVRRLLAAPRPLHWAVAGGGTLVAGVLLALPLVLAAQPAVASAEMSACPLLDQSAAAAQPSA